MQYYIVEKNGVRRAQVRQATGAEPAKFVWEHPEGFEPDSFASVFEPIRAIARSGMSWRVANHMRVVSRDEWLKEANQMSVAA